MSTLCRFRVHYLLVLGGLVLHPRYSRLYGGNLLLNISQSLLTLILNFLLHVGNSGLR